MEAEAVVCVVMENLKYLISDKSFPLNRVIVDQLEKLLESLNYMRSLFIDVADSQTSNESIKKWIDDCLQNLYYVDDTIEAISIGITSQWNRLEFLMYPILSIKNFRLSRKLEKIQTKIDVSFAAFQDTRSRCSQQESGEKLLHKRILDNNNEKEFEIVGSEDELLQQLNRLTKQDYCLIDRILFIVGELGSGKTMLARSIYEDTNIKKFFHCCVWVTLSKFCTTIDLLLNLTKQVVEKPEEEDVVISEQLLKTKLRQHLKDKKYLIVLDDVWSFEQWEMIKNSFPDDKNGSKIIITTCDEQVAMLADRTSPPHYMKKLSYEQSWNVFLKKVSFNEVDLNLKEKIIQSCDGQPLKIVLLGSLLSTKTDKEWASIIDKQKNWQISDILWLCYNDLDAHLKICLLYLAIFPKEFDIPVRRAQRLWVAEGFVKRPQNQDLLIQEDVVQEYFDELVKRSLIQVSEQRDDGSPRKFRLLGALHDYLLGKAQDISLFHVHHNSLFHEEVTGGLSKRRFIDYGDSKISSFKSYQYKHLRSYISFNFHNINIPATYVGDVLMYLIDQGIGLLRVVDLEGVYRPSLPENLGCLYNLGYLGLRQTFLDKLPESVGDLQNLETLDLKHTSIDRIPPTIWKLKKLRHLILDEIRMDKFMPRDSMTQLLTLWGLSIDSESPVKNVLSKLTQLRKLGITFRLRKCDDDNKSDVKNGLCTVTPFAEDLVNWIATLSNLHTLRLRSIDDMGCPSELNLKPFSGLNNLSCMNLLGKLQKLPDKDHFPPNIKVLTLSVTQLHKDPMPILGQLPSLTVLRLLANSYLGEKIVCPRGSFGKLEVLKLWMLKELKSWELEEGAMEKLKELNIRCCSNLGDIPSRLFQQRSFKDLILTNMSEEFKQNVEIKNVDQVSITVKDYKFTPLPWEQEDHCPNAVDVI